MIKNGIYIHIPFCRAKCDYCAFYSVPLAGELEKKGLMAAYSSALIREIESRAPSVRGASDTVFFGGGSPGYLEPAELESVFGALRRSFSIDSDAEITIELNPSDLGGDVPGLLPSLGVNRCTLGVQTLDRTLYEAIGRKGGFCDRALLDSYFSLPGVQHCIDIIGGLPGQTPGMLCRDLETVLSYRPEHVSLYLLTLEENTPLPRRIVADEEFDRIQKETLSAGISFLEQGGYGHYEISNFALPGRRSRHNMKYWTFQPYIGFGAGAHSFIGGERQSNPADIFSYLSGAQPEKDRSGVPLRMAEFIMTSLRLGEGFTTDAFRSFFGCALPDGVMEAALKLSRSGDIVLEDFGGGFRVFISPSAFFFSDSVIFSMVESLL